MPLTVAHSTVVSVPDDGSSPVGSAEWNAAHTVAGTVDLTAQFPSGPANTVLWSNGTTAQWTATPVIGPGTVTAAPLTVVSGPNMTAAAAGVIEYDGTVFYQTATALGRGVSVNEHFLSLAASQAGTNVNTAQPWFPGGGATGITLPATTSYFFEGHLSLSRSAGTTSHTIGLLFGGAATITSIGYAAMVTDVNATTTALSAVSLIEGVAATSTVITAATANAAQFNSIFVKGIARINGAGTFIPQFIYSAAPGGAPTVQANSYFRMHPIGVGGVLNVGNWS